MSYQRYVWKSRQAEPAAGTPAPARLTTKHYRALERELAGDEPEPLSARDPYLLGDPE